MLLQSSHKRTKEHTKVSHVFSTIECGFLERHKTETPSASKQANMYVFSLGNTPKRATAYNYPLMTLMTKSYIMSTDWFP